MFLKQEDNDYKLIYKLFLELNSTFLHHFYSVFDKYIFSPGKTKNDFVKNEINTETMIFNISESLGSREDSLFKKTFNELEYGNKIFKLLYIKLLYVYDYVIQLLYNEDVGINVDWEENINKRYDEMSDKLMDKNTKFIERLRSDFPDLKFLFNKFTKKNEFDKEYERMEGNLITNTIEYNYTLDNIFRMEISIMDQIFLIAKEYYIMIQKSKQNTFPDRSFIHFDEFDYKSFSKPKHLNGNIYIKNENGYHLNHKLLNETLQYKAMNQLKSYYNLVFLPFIMRLNYAIKTKTTDNNTPGYEFEHNHIFSPFTTKALYNLSFNIKRNNLYNDVETISFYSHSIKKEGYNENELRDCYLYRYKLSLMSYIIYHLSAFHNLSLSVIDRIRESTERISIDSEERQYIFVIDDPNPFTMSQIKILVANSYYSSSLKIRQDYYDNEDRIKTNGFNDEINRYDRIHKTIENEMIGKKNYGPRHKFQFFLCNMKIHNYIKMILSGEMTEDLMNLIIENLNDDVVVKLFGNKEIINKDLDYPKRNDFSQFIDNINQGNIVYEQSVNNIVIYNIILLMKILYQIIPEYHSLNKMFYGTLDHERLFKEYKQFVYYAYIPFYLKTLLPEEEERIIKLQPPSEIQIK
jgi:hypothetical protein